MVWLFRAVLPVSARPGCRVIARLPGYSGLCCPAFVRGARARFSIIAERVEFSRGSPVIQPEFSRGFNRSTGL